jgi:hypothetical protein
MKSKLLSIIGIVLIIGITYRISSAKEDGTWCRGFSSTLVMIYTGWTTIIGPEGIPILDRDVAFVKCCVKTTEASLCNFGDNHPGCESLKVVRYNCGTIVFN